MTCIKDEILLQYIDNECSPAQGSRIAAHLSGCGRCREALRTIEDKVKLIKEKSSLLDPENIPEKRVIPLPTRGRRQRWIIPTAAAILLIGLLLFPLFFPESPPAREPQQDLIFSASLEGQSANTYIFKETEPEMTVIWIAKF
jgi:anti-sigma factor RsiW